MQSTIETSLYSDTRLSRRRRRKYERRIQSHSGGCGRIDDKPIAYVVRGRRDGE